MKELELTQEQIDAFKFDKDQTRFVNCLLSLSHSNWRLSLHAEYAELLK